HQILRVEVITFHVINEKHRAEDCEVGGAFDGPPTGTLAWWAVGLARHCFPQFRCDSETCAACLKTTMASTTEKLRSTSRQGRARSGWSLLRCPSPRRSGSRRTPGFLDASMWSLLNRIQHVHDGEHKQPGSTADRALARVQAPGQ